MNKTLLLATSLAVGSIAASASALDVGRAVSLRVDGIGMTLGALTFTPLGVDGPYCDYLADWYSPYNPNDVGICVVQELRTPFAPSCIMNERANVTTIVRSSPAICTGFNLKGESILSTSLILGESCNGLAGVAMFGCAGLVQTYPVNSF